MTSSIVKGEIDWRRLGLCIFYIQTCDFRIRFLPLTTQKP